ncbi:MAG: hypothetical protein GWO24_16275, partial [Akkermansiaceae bacterium]|nr:hypothetical protein [Akkermansiaceae bacterium]
MNPELDRTGKLSDYETLAGFDGNPGSFWSGLCEYGRGRFSADSVCLLLGGGVKGAKLRILAQSP